MWCGLGREEDGAGGQQGQGQGSPWRWDLADLLPSRNARGRPGTATAGRGDRDTEGRKTKRGGHGVALCRTPQQLEPQLWHWGPPGLNLKAWERPGSGPDSCLVSGGGQAGVGWTRGHSGCSCGGRAGRRSTTDPVPGTVVLYAVCIVRVQQWAGGRASSRLGDLAPSDAGECRRQ